MNDVQVEAKVVDVKTEPIAVPPYDPDKGVSLLDFMKDTLKRYNGYKFMSVSKKVGEEGNLALVVAHKEFPINSGGLLISDHSKFIDAVTVSDDNFPGLIMDKKGGTYRTPDPIPEELVKCGYCGEQTPVSQMRGDACLSCLEMAIIVSKFQNEKVDETTQDLPEESKA